MRNLYLLHSFLIDLLNLIISILADQYNWEGLVPVIDSPTIGVPGSSIVLV